MASVYLSPPGPRSQSVQMYSTPASQVFAGDLNYWLAQSDVANVESFASDLAKKAEECGRYLFEV